MISIRQSYLLSLSVLFHYTITAHMHDIYFLILALDIPSDEGTLKLRNIPGVRNCKYLIYGFTLTKAKVTQPSFQFLWADFEWFLVIFR